MSSRVTLFKDLKSTTTLDFRTLFTNYITINIGLLKGVSLVY